MYLPGIFQSYPALIGARQFAQCDDIAPLQLKEKLLLLLGQISSLPLIFSFLSVLVDSPQHYCALALAHGGNDPAPPAI